MIRKLRNKFILINMTIFTAMLLVVFTLVIFFTGAGMQLQNQRMMESITANAFRPSWGQEVRRPHFVVRIDRTGEVVMMDSGFFEEMAEGVLLEYTNAALAQPANEGTLPSQKLRFQKVMSPIGQVIVFADISSDVATMQTLVKSCMVLVLLSMGVFFVISILLARWAIRPVETAWNQQRQFVADASHELKTPLTVILTNAELLSAGTCSPEESRRFVGSIQTMASQMRGLVEGLLDLARVDNGAAQMEFTRLNFSELVQNEVLIFDAVYFEKGLVLDSEIGQSLFVRGSVSHLTQVLEVLLDNGSKYSSAKAKVSLKQQGNHALLSVSTSGDPISREELKHIFKRFYRIDKARAMNQSYGLGLSIAERIVAQHRGKIWAESGDGMNTFYVQLPLV